MKSSHHQLVRQLITDCLPQSSLHLIRCLVGESNDAEPARGESVDLVSRRNEGLTRFSLDQACTP